MAIVSRVGGKVVGERWVGGSRDVGEGVLG